MIDFNKKVKENYVIFQADMTQMLSELQVAINNIDISEEALTSKMKGIINYLFAANTVDNIYHKYQLRNGKWIADIAISTSEKSYKESLADIIIELKRPAVVLKEKHCQQLIRYMVNAKAPWGILTNGREIICYKLLDLLEKIDVIFTTEFDIKDYAFLSFNIDSVLYNDAEAVQKLRLLKEFADMSFRSDKYIEDIKNAEELKEQMIKAKDVLDYAESNYNQLFYFDNKFLSATAPVCVNYLTDANNKEVLDRVLIKNIDIFYTGVDLMSLPLFFELNEKDREEFISFKNNMCNTLSELYTLMDKGIDEELLKNIFTKNFLTLMGYAEDCDFAEIANTYANRVAKVVIKDNPVMFVFYNNTTTMFQKGSKCVNSETPIVIETNGVYFFINYLDSNNQCSYISFNAQDMTFGNMFDLFLLSRQRLTQEVIKSARNLDSSTASTINNHIKEVYSQRIDDLSYINNSLVTMSDAGMDVYSVYRLVPDEYKVSTKGVKYPSADNLSDRELLDFLETSGMISSEMVNKFNDYLKRIFRLEESIQRIQKCFN